MFIFKNLGVNQFGNLTISGHDAIKIAEKYETPLYIMDVDYIRNNCRKFVRIMEEYCQDNALVCYASKAFCCREIYNVIKEENLGIDTVSLGEMFTAISAGFPSEKIYLHGNNKTKKELCYAVENKIGTIVVDNFVELKNLNEIAKEKNSIVNILLRVKPGVDAHVHEYVKTGKEDSKFGFAIKNDEALKAIEEIKTKYKNLNFKGLHYHIGSQIFKIEPFVLAAEKIMDFVKKIKNNLNVEVYELNIGGGFGVQYVEDDEILDLDECIKSVVKAIKTKCEQFGLKMPFLVIEPGRAIVAQAGITLYTVGARKENSNGKIYISVDGGMTDNPRYILYKSIYDAVVANKASEKKIENVSIAGKCCESGDLIGENVPLQPAKAGDVLAVFGTGAYNYSMLSNYNRNLNPAVLFIEGEVCKIVVKRQTLEDLTRNDV